tara:strand:+ start:37 stop:459 length:423 start_codon:yes stop_codon:yes gene_type:complete
MKNIAITIAAVLTLIGCSPEEQVVDAEPIVDLLVSELSWRQTNYIPIDDSYIEVGFLFNYDESNNLEVRLTVIGSGQQECYETILLSNFEASVFNDKVVLVFDNGTITFTTDGRYVYAKSSTSNDFNEYAPDLTPICNSI